MNDNDWYTSYNCTFDLIQRRYCKEYYQQKNHYKSTTLVDCTDELAKDFGIISPKPTCVAHHTSKIVKCIVQVEQCNVVAISDQIMSNKQRNFPVKVFLLKKHLKTVHT